jgi:hypothetical protein
VSRAGRIVEVAVITDDRVVALTRDLEGRRVSIALVNGSRLDDCELISAGRRGDDRLWLFSNGADTFVPKAEIVDLWEVAPSRFRPFH